MKLYCVKCDNTYPRSEFRINRPERTLDVRDGQVPWWAAHKRCGWRTMWPGGVSIGRPEQEVRR